MSSIYKVLTEEEWEHAISFGYVVTKLDNDDGFIHLSTSKKSNLSFLEIKKPIDDFPDPIIPKNTIFLSLIHI